jgi:hypothetical protein
MRDRRRVANRKPTRSSRDHGSGSHWLLLFALLLAAAFIEVWETTTASQLSLEIDRLEETVQQQEARLNHIRTLTAEATSRVRLAGKAEALGLRPADPEQIVEIPTIYLESGTERSLPRDGMVAVTRRIADVFIPSARARDRGVEEGGS